MNRILMAAAAVLLALFVALSSLFVIDQAEQGIIVQFGEPVGTVITRPGLHWRVPFVQEVRRFDKRLLAWDGDVSQNPHARSRVRHRRHDGPVAHPGPASVPALRA